MVVDWFAFPLLVLVVSLGCGLVVERCAGWRIPGALLPGIGLALIIVVASLVTQSQAISRETIWFIVAIAVIGYVTSVARLREMRPDPVAVTLGVLVFLVFAAPVLAYGHPTFLGYGVDGDPAFHFLYADELIAHGHRAISQLPFPQSTTSMLLGSYLKTSYPFGGDVAVGALRSLVGESVPWVYDPFIAFALANGALAIDELLRGTVGSRWMRALCAFVAAQAGITYSFYLISSIKELLTTWLITLTVAVGALILRRAPSARALVPLLVIVAAALYDLEIPALAWIGIPIIVFVVVSAIRLRGSLRRPSARPLAALVAVLGIGAVALIPVISGAITSFQTTTSVLGQSTGLAALGNLISPISLWEIMGIWPNGNYRLPITINVTIVYVLLWLAVGSAILGALWVIRRRAWAPLVLLLGNGIAMWVLLERSTPYAASKVEAIVSVTAVLAAMLGAVALSDLVRPWLGWTLAGVLTLAVLWTTERNFHLAPLAPRARFAELAQINQRYRGQGPTYYGMWDFEWPAFFLRDMGVYLPHLYGDPPAPAGTLTRSVPQEQYPWDLGDITYKFQRSFRTIVLGRSPSMTRPPANYRLVYQGRFYDVYRRTPSPTVLRHVLASDEPDASLYRPRRLTCQRIAGLAAQARREHGELAVSEPRLVASVAANQSAHPDTWVPLPLLATPIPDGLTLYPTPGVSSSVIHVPHAGRYTIWVQGTLTQPMTVSVGLHRIGTISQAIGPATMYTDVGSVQLASGTQPVTFTRQSSSYLTPSAAFDRLGKLAITSSDEPPVVQTIRPGSARTLCGRPLQWVEIVRGTRG